MAPGAMRIELVLSANLTGHLAEPVEVVAGRGRRSWSRIVPNLMSNRGLDVSLRSGMRIDMPKQGSVRGLARPAHAARILMIRYGGHEVGSSPSEDHGTEE
jgi:hypothetical protein